MPNQPVTVLVNNTPLSPWVGNVNAAGFQLLNLGTLQVNNLITVLGGAKASPGGYGLTVVSSDVSNPLQAYLTLVMDATASNRRLSLVCVEQGVAFRNITLCEGGGNVGIGVQNALSALHVVGAQLRWDSGAGSVPGVLFQVSGSTVQMTAGDASNYASLKALSISCSSVAMPNLPSSNPGAGTKQQWYDPADGNRVKFAA